MPLNDGTLNINLQASFNSSDWDSCASLLTSAIDNYITSGTVKTDVTGIVYPPFFPLVSSYSATGKGTGTITTTTFNSLNLSIQTAFKSSAWATVGTIIANAIDSHVKSSTVKTTDSSILVGIGNGTINTAPAISGLIGPLTSIFQTATDWSLVVSTFKSALKTYLTSCIVNTTDAGTIPINSWSGTGTGSIT